MRILKLLNNKYLSIIFFLIFSSAAMADEKPVDIWNIDKKKIEEISSNDNNSKKDKNEKKLDNNIYSTQPVKQVKEIQFDENLNTKDFKIIGLFDPEDYDLDIHMWSNSDGDQLKNIFSKLLKLNLSNDASEILNISILTNSYMPKKNISEQEFLKFKSDWLIKNGDLDLIEEYIIKNEIFNTSSKLSRYLVDYYLSNAEINKSCEIFSKNSKPINDDYLAKFNIYCLLWSNKKDEAQLVYDLKKETGFNDKYFDEKINYLFGYTSKIKQDVSEKSILDFHLAHQTDPEFKFEPKDKTKKIIWKYLSSSNLLTSFKDIETSELDKISTIEKAVHNKNYPEKDLYELYKRFQFNINQLLNAKIIYKSLSSIEARALIYQKILLESQMIEKLELLKILKNSFANENKENAFDIELKKFLKDIDIDDIPSNLTSFYLENMVKDKKINKKIKFNNEIIHQSKLINYFNGDFSKNKIEKDINNFLKKIKKNKKYSLSKKDIILIESLKSDGIKIDKKYDNLYMINSSEIPTDLQVIINNNEKGAALLRIAEVIGQDDLERIDEDTIYFIIATLNELNIDIIRNKILLKVLPLKV